MLGEHAIEGFAYLSGLSRPTNRTDIVDATALQKFHMFLISKRHDLVTSILKWVHWYARRPVAIWCINGLCNSISDQLWGRMLWECLVDTFHHDRVCTV